MYSVDDNSNYLRPLFNEVNKIKEPFNQCRQVLPTTYLHNGYIDIIKTEVRFTNINNCFSHGYDGGKCIIKDNLYNFYLYISI